MKAHTVPQSAAELPWLLFLHGYSGAGKTKLFTDFHNGGLKGIAVTRERRPLETILQRYGATDVPIIEPETDLELRAITEAPDTVLAKYASGYQPDLWFFENMRALQLLLLGRAKRAATKTEGGLEVPERTGYGILHTVPKAKQDNSDNPSQLAYRTLENETMSVFHAMANMRRASGQPYHVMVSCHSETFFAKDAAQQKRMPHRIVPNLEGFAMKINAPSFFKTVALYMEENNNRFTMHFRNADAWAANQFGWTGSIDWTNKDGFDILSKKREEK